MPLRKTLRGKKTFTVYVIYTTPLSHFRSECFEAQRRSDEIYFNLEII